MTTLKKTAFVIVWILVAAVSCEDGGGTDGDDPHGDPDSGADWDAAIEDTDSDTDAQTAVTCTLEVAGMS